MVTLNVTVRVPTEHTYDEATIADRLLTFTDELEAALRQALSDDEVTECALNEENMLLITSEQVRAQNPCRHALAIFEAEWPDGCEVTEANILRAYELKLDIDWAVTRFLPMPLLEEYKRALAPLWKEYKRALAPLWAEYKSAEAPLWKEYERAKTRLIMSLVDKVA